jgi:hypothetical protein
VVALCGFSFISATRERDLGSAQSLASRLLAWHTHRYYSSVLFRLRDSTYTFLHAVNVTAPPDQNTPGGADYFISRHLIGGQQIAQFE